MRTVAERYGYVEYGGPLIEESALYRAKTGEEIANEETYTFTDRGGRDVTLRPEMTPTIARMIAAKQKELAFPLRLYSIPNLFRYERPQRGRVREHWQLNVDVFGIASVEADAEIIAVAVSIMEEFGAQSDQFQVRVNNRKFLHALLHEYFKFSPEQAHSVSKLIDKKLKMDAQEFSDRIKEIIEEKADEFIGVLGARDIESLPVEVRNTDGIKEIAEVRALLEQKKIENTVFDPTLVRGFDYYTGTVFEIFDTDTANQRSLFGGGRYDDLLDIFGSEKVPAVGFGMGDVTIHDFLKTHVLLPAAYSPTTHLYLCRFSSEYAQFTEEFAKYLREKGINVAIDLSNRKIGAQVKTAHRQGIRFVICIGTDEIKSQLFRVKDLVAHKETEPISQERVVGFIKENFGSIQPEKH